ncbi:MAG: molybdopterin converting factor subunit 1 [Pseudomonadota bacterium]
MRLVYFAQTRQVLGKSTENIDLPAQVTTIRALVAHLSSLNDLYAKAFSDSAALRFAKNQNLVDSETAIADQDELAIFPPFTGG